MLGFFVLALQLFVTLVAFKLGSLAAFVALPWGVFSGTAWVAERPLGWVVGSAIRLFILAFIASIAITFVDTLPATLTLDSGGALNVMLFGLTVLGLAWFGPQLASEVVQGQPHLAASDAVRGAAGFAIAGAAGVAGGVYGGRLGLGLGGAAIGGARRAITRMRGSSSGGASKSGGKPSVNYAAMKPKPRSGGEKP
jgi:type IV secretion system protein TrbL